jgi:thiol-disulfide isomerase/thioredoxin
VPLPPDFVVPSASNKMGKDVKGRVKDSIESSKVVVFSKSYCPYCKKAKQALEQYTVRRLALYTLLPSCAA